MNSATQEQLFETAYQTFQKEHCQDVEWPNHQKLIYDETYQEYRKNGHYILRPCSAFFPGAEKISCTFHSNIPIALLPHTHDFFEIVYVYSGSVLHRIDGSEQTLHSGDISIINPNVVHCLSKTDSQTMIFNLLIKTELLSDAFFVLGNMNNVVFEFFSRCLYQNSMVSQIFFPQKSYSQTGCRQFLHNIITESITRKIGYEKSIEHNLQLFCLELTRAYAERPNLEAETRMKNANIEQIISYITKNYHTATIHSVAENFHYHPTYLPQLLKKHTGKTFIEIQQMIRISAAKEHLNHTSSSIEEVAKYVGYSNTSHFYKIFRKITGLSPLQYKKISQR